MGLAVLAAGCSSATKVGGGLAAKDGRTTTSACRLGECTTTTTAAAAATTAVPRPTSTTSTTAKPVATTAPPRPTSTTAAAPATPFVIKIQGDNASGGQLAPSDVTVPRGTVVRWTNADSIPRSVEAENGSFTSPKIAPGASWDYRPLSTGTFEYHDGTRPYAVASLKVT
ncbi:MAG TPA: hypothetical protein VFA94_11665 [Acidimicrobiales bacterium]|nr:hypothetical protein [Acidimicrobiales bacterium]